MQAREFQRNGAVLKGWSKAFVLAHLISFCLMCPAQTQLEQQRVAAAEQAGRDDERLRILRDELKKTEALVDSLARRKAERLAAADVSGANEAEEHRIRALSDVAGLRREIGATPPVAASKPATASAFTETPVKRLATPRNPSSPAPWWDVYAKVNRGDTAAPVSFAPPSPADSARKGSPRTE